MNLWAAAFCRNRVDGNRCGRGSSWRAASRRKAPRTPADTVRLSSNTWHAPARQDSTTERDSDTQPNRVEQPRI